MADVHIITGGSSGIGLGAARNFNQGKVIITGRTEETLKKAEKELKEAGVDVGYKTSDITDRESLKELFEFGKTFGRIKTVVNSAGVSGGMASAKQTLEIDLFGTENMIEETYKHAEEDTSLILIGSMMGYIVPDDEEVNELLANPSEEGAIDRLVEILNDDSDEAYNYSKKGVHLMVKKYANKFGEKDARINSISPGIIMTPMAKKAAEDHPEQMEQMKSLTPMSRNGEREDVSNAVCFLASDNSSFVTGIDLLVDGGLSINLAKVREEYER